MGTGLSGKTALVTGGSRGIGRAISIILAEAGADVIAVARGRAGLEKLAQENSRIAPWVVDICDPEFCTLLEKRDIDILVNNAGTNTPLPMVEVCSEILDGILGINVRGAYLVAQSCVKSVLRRNVSGSIVNITSQLGNVGRTVYCMAKHGLEGLTKAMAVELAPLLAFE